MHQVEREEAIPTLVTSILSDLEANQEIIKSALTQHLQTWSDEELTDSLYGDNEDYMVI